MPMDLADKSCQRQDERKLFRLKTASPLQHPVLSNHRIIDSIRSLVLLYCVSRYSSTGQIRFLNRTPTNVRIYDELAICCIPLNSKLTFDLLYGEPRQWKSLMI